MAVFRPLRLCVIGLCLRSSNALWICVIDYVCSSSEWLNSLLFDSQYYTRLIDQHTVRLCRHFLMLKAKHDNDSRPYPIVFFFAEGVLYWNYHLKLRLFASIAVLMPCIILLAINEYRYFTHAQLGSAPCCEQFALTTDLCPYYINSLGDNSISCMGRPRTETCFLCEQLYTS